jgi:tellurite resistance protein
LRTAVSVLESKAPDEVDEYRRFVLEVAQSVADAAGGGETAETGVVERIRSALRSPAST